MWASWAAVVATAAGVLVAAVAAYYLRKTLRETQEGTRLMREQLWSNRAYLACIDIKCNYHGTYSSEDGSDASVTLISEWVNFGLSPANAVTFGFHVFSQGNVYPAEVEASFDKIPSGAIIGQGEKKPLEQRIIIPLINLSVEPDIKNYVPMVVILWAKYQDIHKRQFQVQQGVSVRFQSNLFSGALERVTVEPDDPSNVETTLQLPA
ncbi:hypothetical protein PHACT_12465 [Pseudohongiella acticola]|uniref:Uncharacterized protein n=1 Tax=Pseudohongiella acticola TaxID=1524254 RepID=A0A1E8CFX1_9GAMM|nr:hypothetical protein [Pseudohongiella acticola]OFE11364.1 hypothetical protein PHACT_12465 [Pseudohongiella acticola]